ncbi:MAG: HAD family phosphatase [Candidatus Planktophila sp.]|jgi:HAD superfamily hydrolase (TIGR01509 family)|tara:strand:- start:1244 stop:1918 length:675 start_codon:yes stop_codon:yes gene_type:complete
MFEAVLFDMDGLFIDSEPDWHEAEAAMMKSYGYPWQDSDQLQCLGGPLSRVSEYMSKCLQGTPSAALLAEQIIAEMDIRLKSRISYMPGAIEFSQKILDLGLPQAMVSASPRSLVDRVLSHFKNNHFQTTVASGDIPRTKPFPDPYLHAAKVLGADISKSIIFEDSPTGLKAAKESGAFVVAIPKFFSIAEEPRLKVIKSFVDIEITDLELWSEANHYELDKLS